MKTASSILVIIVLVSTAFAGEDRRSGRICTPEGNWRTIFSDQDLTVYSKRMSGSRVLAFKADGVLEAPIDQIMEVMRRVEIVGEWMPDIREKFTLEEISDVEVVTYSINGRFKL